LKAQNFPARKTQKSILKTEYTPLSINTCFGVQLPATTLADRFGLSLGVGGGFELARIPSGWLFGLDAQYFFGTKVKEDVLAHLRTPDGNLISDINTYADVELRQRGLYIGINGGKIIQLHDNRNRFGGIRLVLGIGWLNHRIRIQDNTQGSVPHLAAAYARGYDRFTAGIALNQSIGYQIISRDRTINMFIALDLTQGFTKNQRGFNFDTMQRDDARRLDILYGVRVGWSLPIYNNINSEDIEY
jgi:hypothetical protein